MYLNNLLFVNFKNYEELELEFSPGINAFVGYNGSGKTTILDGIYFLSMCKSYLNRIDRQNIRFDQTFFSLFGHWSLDNKLNKQQLTVKSGSKKIVKLNKKEYDKISEHIGKFPVVFISPYDGDLIAEGSQLRRKWIDGILVQLDLNYLEILVQYQKVLEQRNALLKNMHEHRLFDPESIEVWDTQLIKLGEQIHKKRLDFFKEFSPFFQDYYKNISDSKEEVSITYESQLNNADFSILLKNTIKKDLQTQFSNVGTHKDDMLFSINEHPIKKFGSQGQQKSFLISLRLAQFEWLKKHKGIKPILLLDDIFDKLDYKRVTKLVNLVSDNYFGQVFITDTDKDRMLKLFQNIKTDKRLFEIHDSSCRQIEINEVQKL